MILDLIKKSAKPQLMRIAKALVSFDKTCKQAYSQEGEDLVIFRLLALDQFPRVGFYVDVGAHHPQKYSNTCFFYERGWRGINIDAAPGSMENFALSRRRDINLELAIAEQQEVYTFYEFSSPELSGFNKELSEARASMPGCSILQKRQVAALRLETILDQNVPEGVQIDFMSIDVEGLDLEVIRSNDWKKYRPLLVLVEDSNVGTISDISNSPVTKFMLEQGYQAISKTALTMFFAPVDKIVRGLFGTHIGDFNSKSLSHTNS